jgi:hypothetical protein
VDFPTVRAASSCVGGVEVRGLGAIFFSPAKPLVCVRVRRQQLGILRLTCMAKAQSSSSEGDLT